MDSQTLSPPQFQPNFTNGVNNGPTSDSENDDGFVSGEDDITDPARPILVYPDAKSTLQEQQPFDEQSPRPIAKVSADEEDDAEEDEEGGDDEKDDVFVEAVKDGDFSDSHEVFVEANDNGFEGGDFEGVVEDEINKFLKEEEDDGGNEFNNLDSAVVESVSGDDFGVGSVVENGDGDEDVEKFTSGEDFVVDSLKVDTLGDGGVAVVGDEVKVEESEIVGVEVIEPVVSVDNSFEPIEKVGSDGVVVVDEVGDSFETIEKGGDVVDEVVGRGGEVLDIGVDDEVVGRGVESGEVIDIGVDDEKGGETVVDEVVGRDAEVVDIGVDDGVSHEQVSDIASIEKSEESSGVVNRSLEGGGEEEVINVEGGAVVGEVESFVDEAVEEEVESNVEGGDGGHVDRAVAGEIQSNVDPVVEEEAESNVDLVVDRIAESNVDRVVEGEAKSSVVGGEAESSVVEGEAESNVVEGEAESSVVEGEAESNVVEGENRSHVEAAVEGKVESSIDCDVEAEDESHVEAAVEGEVMSSIDNVVEVEDESHVEAAGEGDEEVDHHVDREIDDSLSDKRDGAMIFGGSDSANKYLEELEKQLRASESSQDDRIDGQIVTDSDEEAESDDEGDSKELFDTATLAALLKAASGAGGEDGSGITITAQDGSRLFSVERPAGLGPSLQTGKPAVRSTRPNIFNSSFGRPGGTVSDTTLSEEDKRKLEKVQEIRIKFLRLVQRLGFTTEESIAAQVLYRMTLVAGRQTGEIFSLDAAKESASRLEAEGRDDLDFSINILVLGKTGVGKSATINSIFGETKTSFSAYGPATTAVTEVVGVVDGVKVRVFDTPGLKSSAFEQGYNRKVLATVKKLTKKSPPDIVLYVDRLDLQTRDMNDLPMLRSVTSALGPTIWRNVIVTLTHAASAPPDGPTGTPLSYDVFVAQRSHIVQQTIGQAVGDLRLMNPSLMNPVSLVENHPSCRKNRDGQKVLPNGQSWRPLLLLLSYSMKILSEAGNVSKSQETPDNRRLFGFRTRSPPLPYLLSWLLQSRAHPKLPDQGGLDNGDSDVEMADLSDSDADEAEDEYEQLPPFKPLKKSQFAKLNKEQRKAYLEEYDYRVKLLQKRQWREELKRMREMKKRGGKTFENDSSYMEEDDQENGSPAAVPVPLPDMVLPPSFDSDNPAYRYRFLEPTSQLLTRPVLDTHSWDHDCGYDGVNIENSMTIISKFPAAVNVQVTKDKQDFSIHLDSSVAAKHGESASTMAGFDIQNIGKQLAYIVRGETKFKNFKRNKTAAGVSVTFLGENVSTGVKLEDQIALGKRLVLVGSTGTVRSQSDSAYGANVEVRLREADFPIGQDQSSLSLSLVQWRGDLALGANFQSQFSLGRSYKMGVRAGLNNKLSGQISVRTSSSDQLQIALIAVLPIVKAIYKNFWPGASEQYSNSIY